MVSGVTTPPTSTFAIIIGAGPVGVYAGISLARYGYRSVVLERRNTRLPQPKAHVINSRSLEIFRQDGFPMEEIRNLAAAREDAMFLRWELSLTGVEYGNFQFERQDEDVKEFTPEPLLNIPQPLLEAYLEKHALNTGLVSIYRGWQWQSCKHRASGQIMSEALNVETGDSLQIQSKYLFACDGAHSRARKALGISTLTPPSAFPTAARYVSAMIKSDWTRFRDGTLHIIIQGKELRVFIVYDRASTWVFMFGVAHDDPIECFTEQFCRDAIDKAVGEKVDYEIVDIRAWEAALRVTDNFRSPIVPNAFVAGDAAHTFSNAGGLGVNTGFADVHNLMWKVHAVEQGWCTRADVLFDTYTTERKPVADIYCASSDYDQYRVTAICEKVNETMGNDPVTTYQDPDKRQALEAVINAQWSFSDHLNLHLGYVYGQDNLGFNPQGGEEIPANSLFFKSICVPGGRLPHAWILQSNIKKSTLDLVDKSAFTVLATSGHKGLPVGITKGRNNIPMIFCQVGRDFDDTEGAWSDLVFQAGKGLVVVRPDQHVLGMAANVEELDSVLYEGLGGI